MIGILWGCEEGLFVDFCSYVRSSVISPNLNCKLIVGVMETVKRKEKERKKGK